eukprot:2488527-Rhodomonas_salina.2
MRFSRAWFRGVCGVAAACVRSCARSGLRRLCLTGSVLLCQAPSLTLTLTPGSDASFPVASLQACKAPTHTALAISSQFCGDQRIDRRRRIGE